MPYNPARLVLRHLGCRRLIRTLAGGAALMCALFSQQASADCPPFITYTATGVALPAEGGSVSCNPGMTHCPNTTAQCDAVANPGWAFLGYTQDTGKCDLVNGWGTASCQVAGATVWFEMVYIDDGDSFARAQFGPVITTAAEPAEMGSFGCTPNPVPYGGSTTCTAAPLPGNAVTGFSGDFVGDCTADSCFLTNVTAPANITAQFVAVGQHTITTHVDAPPEAGGAVTCEPNPVTHGADSICTGSGNPGWAVVAFSGACTGSSCLLSNVIADDLSVTGTFGFVGTHDVITAVEPVGAGTVTCTANPVTHSTSTTCTATADRLYEFSHFSGDCAGATCTLSDVTGERNVTAHFTARTTYAIDTHVDPPGTGSLTCDPNPVLWGESSDCTATAGPGYRFAGFVDCFHPEVAPGVCRKPDIQASLSLTARFTAIPTYTVTVGRMPNAGGSVTCAPENPVIEGLDVVCTAAPAAGYRFTGFQGDCSGSECALDNLSANKSVFAWFRQDDTAIPLNDSGQVNCADDYIGVPCDRTQTGDRGVFPRQDGRFGRDAQARAGQLVKQGAGFGGLDFTPLDADGNEIAIVDGRPASRPACVQDNVTGLTWEVRSEDGGLRHYAWSYTWNEGYLGVAGGGECGDTLPAGCDTAAYVAAVNQAGLCGHQDWRLPRRRELRSLLAFSAPHFIDNDFFPDALQAYPSGSEYWTSDFTPEGRPWTVLLTTGRYSASARSEYPSSVRLVRREAEVLP